MLVGINNSKKIGKVILAPYGILEKAPKHASALGSKPPTVTYTLWSISSNS